MPAYTVTLCKPFQGGDVRPPITMLKSADGVAGYTKPLRCLAQGQLMLGPQGP